jgi:hypothetical protein
VSCAPFVDPDPTALDTELTEQRLYLVDHHGRPAHEVQRRRVIDQKREIFTPDSPARSTPTV